MAMNFLVIFMTYIVAAQGWHEGYDEMLIFVNKARQDQGLQSLCLSLYHAIPIQQIIAI